MHIYYWGSKMSFCTFKVNLHEGKNTGHNLEVECLETWFVGHIGAASNSCIVAKLEHEWLRPQYWWSGLANMGSVLLQATAST